MMWKRARSDAAMELLPLSHAPARSTSSSLRPLRDTAQEDAAIDTVVGVFRTLGRLPFWGTPDAADIQRLYDTWATHLAIGGPHPDQARADDDERPPVLPQERDWVGARRFVQARRELECELVARTVGHSHELIWDLTDRLAKTVLDTRERDREVLEQLDQLRAAIESGSLERVEEAVRKASETLTGAIQQREQRLQTQLVELGGRVAELSEQLQEVKVESRLDGLTRVRNRADFDQAIKRWHHVGSVFDRPTCLLLVDVDHLKSINDQYGHRGGDAALRMFADALVRCFPRRSDFVGRYGGDEFVVLLGEAPARAGLRLAERFCQFLHAAVVEHDGQQIQLTASIGLAQLEPGETIESWLERADQALYQAKAGGRNQVAVARPPDPPEEAEAAEAAG